MTACVAERTDRRFHTPAVVAMAFGTFGYVTAETLPIGLLPQISEGLAVSEASVGLLMTFYAAVAGLTAIPFTALTAHLPRHRVITGCLVVFTLSQVCAALAPSFTVLVLSRLVAALAHGVFWSVLAPVAARLAPPGQAGRATSLVFVGNSIGLIAGVPLGTAIGQLTDWRVSFAVMGLMGAVAVALLFRFLPVLPSTTVRTHPVRQVADAVRVLRSRPVAVLCAITMVVVIGHFAAYTYIVPIARHAGGLSGLTLSALLLGYGLAGILGNLLAGHAADRRPRPALCLCVAVVVASLTALAIGPGTVGTVVAVLAWGMGFTAIPVSLQSAVMRVAPHAQESASALYVVAFQIGIGGGALVGERLVGAGHLGTLPTAAAIAAVLALALVYLARSAFPDRIPVVPATRPAVWSEPTGSRANQGPRTTRDHV